MHSVHHGTIADAPDAGSRLPEGEFVTLNDERYYRIDDVDRMPPFFISVVSDADHWLFVASNGGLTAGRVSPETALLPYVTVDKIYDSTPHTGSKTVVRLDAGGRSQIWEPLDPQRDGRYRTTRRIYKNLLGNKLVLEEINHDLQLAFRCHWLTSSSWGFVRQSEIENLGERGRRVDILDGLQNLLPAGTPRLAQTNTSYLVDAYKWNELHEATGLAMYALFSGISDRAEPCESLRANTAFCLGLDQPRTLLSSIQLDAFRNGGTPVQEAGRRGVRGAYLVSTTLDLEPVTSRSWRIVADVERSQADVVRLIGQLADPEALAAAVDDSIAAGTDALARIMGAGDAFQTTAEEIVSAHHYSNVLFNVLRGGIVDDQYRISAQSFRAHLSTFNRSVAQRHRELLDDLPETLAQDELLARARSAGDPQLERLTCEYLPITFGRRHGDPSRPWNQFSIRLQDESGVRLLAYEGNWRDIFQNWEALLLSYPEFVDQVIAKFVNASTADGYNPYRITSNGIDWEVEEPDDPWSYIGYWGDHQIIYLLKLLELSRNFHPERLKEMLREPIYAYANVPYRIRPFADIVADAKATVDYDAALAERIEERVREIGADGRLLRNALGETHLVTLSEKLLVPLLAKLGNLVVDGGIWLNTQRPEWNDANNALVGYGLSMVTLCYMRRYVRFLRDLLGEAPGPVKLSAEVAQWLAETAAPLAQTRSGLSGGRVAAADRYRLLAELGQAAGRYRATLYEREALGDAVDQDSQTVTDLLDDALAIIDHSIVTNRRDDGLYHAYNLLNLGDESAEVDALYPMLEGQVAALSSGAIGAAEAADLLEALFASDVFRPDQSTFLLYPERELPGFLDKNRIAEEPAAAIPLIATMLADGERRIVERDAQGTLRFNADLTNVGDLNARLDALTERYGEALAAARAPLCELYEQVFRHRAFTGRSGGMFGFEGLGCVYWHMVGKLLLAVQENCFAALDADTDAGTVRRLGDLYYRVRQGLGFNKTPAEYGAFPADPYSHTPGHMGAQQPGMTGQVKEELLARYGELGIRVAEGAVRFDTRLLRGREFLGQPGTLRYLDVDGNWQDLAVPAGGLAFTWCQVPIVYRIDAAAEPGLVATLADGEREVSSAPTLAPSLAQSVFRRDGRVRHIELILERDGLFD